MGFWVIPGSEAKEACRDHKVTKDQQETLDGKDRLYVITAVGAKPVVQELPQQVIVRMSAPVTGRRWRSRFDGVSRIPRSKSMFSFFSVRS